MEDHGSIQILVMEAFDTTSLLRTVVFMPASKWKSLTPDQQDAARMARRATGIPTGPIGSIPASSPMEGNKDVETRRNQPMKPGANIPPKVWETLTMEQKFAAQEARKSTAAVGNVSLILTDRGWNMDDGGFVLH